MRGINAYDARFTAEEIAQGRHRIHVGGLWEEMGALQFAFMVERGLQPQHLLLDVGCGSMRGGIHFAKYLEPGHYFGIDVNEGLIEAAQQVEIPAAGLSERVPPRNLHLTDRFDAPFGVTFDYAVAVSLFTHLPLNHVKLCLHRVAEVVKPGGRFLATFFAVSEDAPYDVRQEQSAGVTTRAEVDPFHYRPSEMKWASEVGPWKFNYIGEWGHPRGQHMAEFERL